MRTFSMRKYIYIYIVYVYAHIVEQIKYFYQKHFPIENHYMNHTVFFFNEYKHIYMYIHVSITTPVVG